MTCHRLVNSAPDIIVHRGSGVGVGAEDKDGRGRDEILGSRVAIDQARTGHATPIEDGAGIDAAKGEGDVTVGAGRDYAPEQRRGIPHMQKASRKPTGLEERTGPVA